jgi:hypothetical protein
MDSEKTTIPSLEQNENLLWEQRERFLLPLKAVLLTPLHDSGRPTQFKGGVKMVTGFIQSRTIRRSCMRAGTPSRDWIRARSHELQGHFEEFSRWMADHYPMKQLVNVCRGFLAAMTCWAVL